MVHHPDAFALRLRHLRQDRRRARLQRQVQRLVHAPPVKDPPRCEQLLVVFRPIVGRDIQIVVAARAARERRGDIVEQQRLDAVFAFVETADHRLAGILGLDQPVVGIPAIMAVDHPLQPALHAGRERRESFQRQHVDVVRQRIDGHRQLHGRGDVAHAHHRRETRQVAAIPARPVPQRGVEVLHRTQAVEHAFAAPVGQQMEIRPAPVQLPDQILQHAHRAAEVHIETVDQNHRNLILLLNRIYRP